jgi:hypothetical protein
MRYLLAIRPLEITVSHLPRERNPTNRQCITSTNGPHISRTRICALHGSGLPRGSDHERF